MVEAGVYEHLRAAKPFAACNQVNASTRFGPFMPSFLSPPAF
jgi:hypothetical protein